MKTSATGIVALFALISLFIASNSALADPPPNYSTTFENFAPGSIYGQNDGGQSWSDVNSVSGADYNQSITPGAGLVSGQAWLLSNSYADGAKEGISAPTIEYAGEGVDSRGNVPSGNQFTESFDFRTVSTSAEPNLDISNSISQAASIRDTYVEIQNVGGSLYVDAYATDADGNFTINPVSPALTWGDWYQIDVTADFIPGPDNDMVTYTVVDATTGATVWSTTIGSWESYYANDPSAEGAPLVDVDKVTWDLGDAPGGGSDDSGIYIDNFSEGVSQAPEPPAYALLLAGVAVLGWVLRRKVAPLA